MNVMHDCRTAGISIEHGHHNHMSGNDIQGARYGVHLWWDEDQSFLQGPFGQNQDCSSSRNIIAMNRLSGTVAALRLWGDTGSTVNDNAFPADHSRMELGPGTLLGALKGNGFRHLTIVNRTGSPFVLGDDNGVRDGISHEGDPTSFVGEIRSGWRPPLRLESLLTFAPPPRIAYPDDMPAGRDQIRIDEWGPIDPRETRLFPAEQSAAGEVAKIHLLGSKAFEIVETSEGVEAVPARGTAPVTLEVLAKGSKAAILPFRVVVASDGQRFEASGTLLRMPWEVSWYRWTDAEDPMTKPDAFAALLAGEPVRRIEAASLEFPWQGGGPEGVGGDGFATTATSTVTLPAGRYRARVVSDDGVRLFVDGKMVVERWDRHGPTEDVAALDLTAGEHTFRLVHFEIDGWAWLAFRLESVTD
jgi:hypothetical protein